MNKVELLKQLQKLICFDYCKNRDKCQSYDLAQKCPVHKKFNELLEMVD